MTLLSVRRASKAYNGFPALIDVSLDLYPGEVHALMGENGAGKSTLIRLLAGVTPADSIAIALRGTPILISSPQAASAYGLRFIYQELNTVPQVSVAENIFLGTRFPTRGGVFVAWPRLRAEARSVLGAIGITHIDPAAIMARLSPGDQMLVRIAASLVGGETAAAVYVMDEPTAALSAHEIGQLFAVIRRLSREGRAILYVSHRMDEIFTIADRVTVLRDGRVVNSGPIGETTPASLIEAMTGRMMQQVFPPPPATVPTPLTIASQAPRLQVAGLRTYAVRDINFSVARGEVLGIAGLAGSGRTELLRALIGADRRLAGRIWLDGEPLARQIPRNAWKAGIAYIPEERRSQALVLGHSLSNNVVLPHLRSTSLAGLLLNRRRERQLTVRLGAQVRLKASSPAQKVRELSGGNQQKAVFARALAGQPRLLLLDEPTRGVDVGAKYDIYTLIRAASAEGAAIIIVSSDLPELIGLCDRILILRGGVQSADVPAAGLTEGALLTLCYGNAAESPAAPAPEAEHAHAG